MSFHIHFVRFISDARLLLKPPAAGKFVNINIYTADRHWLGRWQPQQCKRRPPPHLLLGPGDASLPVTDRTWLTAAISVAVSLVVRACVCLFVFVCVSTADFVFDFTLFFSLFCCDCCSPLAVGFAVLIMRAVRVSPRSLISCRALQMFPKNRADFKLLLNVIQFCA